MSHALYREKIKREHKSDYIIYNLAKWYNLFIHF